MKTYINNTLNYYETYFIDDNTRPTILISAGGGYQYTSPRESKPVALAFNKMGYHAVVVNYRETMDLYPTPGMNLAYVLKLLKEDKRVSKIVGLGFSAGGHNILEITLHKADYYNQSVDLLILGYPVVTSDIRYSHQGSFKYLLGDNPDSTLFKKMSLENEVTADSPDLFLFGTFNDNSVPVMNSLLLLEAYDRAKCNAEYHVYYDGVHGLSLGTSESSEGNKLKENPHFAEWIIAVEKWLKLKLN